MSFLPTTVPTKTLLVSITNSALTFRLNNIKGWDNVNLSAADFGTQAFCVFRNAQRTRVEIMEFDPSTIASSSITIVKRGLDFTGDLTTEIAANKYSWTKGDTYVDLGTDTPQLWQWLKEYTDGVAIAGAPNASTTTKGLVEEATQAQYSAQTGTGETGARLFVPPSLGPVIETTTGTTYSLTTIAGQRVMVWAKGTITGAGATISLKYNTVTKDSLVHENQTYKNHFAMMYTETPGAATANITVETSVGSVTDVVIMVLKF